jgi:hypothetical protein
VAKLTKKEEKMKKIIGLLAMVMVITAPFVFAADWQFVGTSNENTKFYVDNTSIKVSDNNIFFTVREDQYRDGVDYVIFDWQINCQIRKARYTKGWVYWTGKDPEFAEVKATWMTIKNETWLETLANKNCK